MPEIADHDYTVNQADTLAENCKKKVIFLWLWPLKVKYLLAKYGTVQCAIYLGIKKTVML